MKRTKSNESRVRKQYQGTGLGTRRWLRRLVSHRLLAPRRTGTSPVCVCLASCACAPPFFTWPAACRAKRPCRRPRPASGQAQAGPCEWWLFGSRGISSSYLRRRARMPSLQNEAQKRGSRHRRTQNLPAQRTRRSARARTRRRHFGRLHSLNPLPSLHAASFSLSLSLPALPPTLLTHPAARSSKPVPS